MSGEFKQSLATLNRVAFNLSNLDTKIKTERANALSVLMYLFDTIDITWLRSRVSRFVCIFLPVGKKNYCVAPSSRRQQRSFALHLIFRISISKKEKLTSFLSKPVNLSWSECRDSNSRPLEPHSSAIPNFATPGYSAALSGLAYTSIAFQKNQALFLLFSKNYLIPTGTSFAYFQISYL